MGLNAYLSLAARPPLSDFQCQIVPLEHIASTRQCEGPVFEEIQVLCFRHTNALFSADWEHFAGERLIGGKLQLSLVPRAVIIRNNCLISLLEHIASTRQCERPVFEELQVFCF